MQWENVDRVPGSISELDFLQDFGTNEIVRISKLRYKHGDTQATNKKIYNVWIAAGLRITMLGYLYL